MARGNNFSLRNLLAGLAIVVASLGAPAFAQSTPQQCAVIADDGERLACYDGLFQSSGEAADAVTVQSERMIPARPTGRDFAKMIVACLPEGIDVSFEFAGQLVSNTGDIAAVTFQVDQGGTTVRTLPADDENSKVRFATPRDAGAFLDGLAGGRNLKVRMTPVRQRSVTVDFRLQEVADQIAAVRASCG